MSKSNMKIEDLKDELKYKQKTINDLAEFIRNRTGEVPNYCLFLGAGCSVTSGVKTGAGLIKKWRVDIFQQLYQKQSEKSSTCKYSYLLNKDEYDETDYEKIVEFLKAHAGEWYFPNKEYSSLFEKKFDLPRQRRAFIEKEIRDKKPSIGYAYLTRLMGEKYFNTIFTTNFDDLVNEAFYLFSSDERPIICAHDSAISSVTVSSSRPKVIKLHGDYLFDDIKNTITETESLEVNMKEKFKEFAKDYGLIVMGYSGNDRSIMDILNLLQKDENYYKNGIYWIFRSNSEINEDLRRLLRHDRVFFIIDDGFDEVMASLYSKLISDEHLPIDIETFNKKPTEILRNFLNNEYTMYSKSKKIIEDLTKMKEISVTNSSYDVLKEINFLEELKENFDDIPDNFFPILFEIEHLVNQKKYKQAINKCKDIIDEQDNNDIKKLLYIKLLHCYQKLKNKEEALSIIKKIREINPRDPMYHLYELPFLDSLDKKIASLDEAIKKDEFKDEFYHKKAIYLIKQLKEIYGLTERGEQVQNIISCLKLGITKNPSIENPCYFKLYDFVNDKKYLIEERLKQDIREEILQQVKSQTGHSPRLLKYYLADLRYDSSDQEKDDFFQELSNIKEKSHDNKLTFDVIEVNALIKVGKYIEARQKLDKVSMEVSDSKYRQNFAEKESNLILLQEGNYLKAADILISMKDDNQDIETKIIEYLIRGNDLDTAKNRLNSIKQYLDKEKIISFEIQIHEINYEWEEAIKKTEVIRNTDKTGYVTGLSYLYLQQREYEKAKDVTEKFLEAINFSPLEPVININYLLAKKLYKGKLNNEAKLNNLLPFCESSLSKAAIYSLWDDKAKVFKYLEEALIQDRSDYYYILRWPIFNDFRKTEEYRILNEKFLIDELKSSVIDNKEDYKVISPVI